MINSFTIKNSLGFIGFCFIREKETSKIATILLFDCTETEENINFVNHSFNNKIYSSAHSNEEIILNLIQHSLPHIKINSLDYFVIDENGKHFSLNS